MLMKNEHKKMKYWKVDLLKSLADSEIGYPVDGTAETHGIGSGTLWKQFSRDEPRNWSRTDGKGHDEENHKANNGVTAPIACVGLRVVG